MASVVLLALRAGSAFAGAGASSTAGAAGSRAAPFLPFFGVALPATSAAMGISSSESLLDMFASSKCNFGRSLFRCLQGAGGERHRTLACSRPIYSPAGAPRGLAPELGRFGDR